jgi:hypothetical protein
LLYPKDPELESRVQPDRLQNKDRFRGQKLFQASDIFFDPDVQIQILRS